MFAPDLVSAAERTLRIYERAGWKMATAESCTGGLVAGLITSVAGSSAVFDRGFVTYSNEAKIDLLGVLPDLLQTYGAVSGEVAEAMAQGALDYSQSHVAVSVTGIAGPGGGSAQKPVGLVCFGLAVRAEGIFHVRCQFAGGREAVRQQAVAEALKLLQSAVQKDKN